MKSTLLLLACVTALFTSLAEPDELFLSTLEARLFLLGQVILTWELWCRKESWKVLSIHLVAICFLFSMSTSTPNQAPNFFILLSCLFLGIVIMIVNPEKHQRSLMNPSPTPVVDDFYGIEWSQLPMFAPQIFTITDPYDSDSGDEDQMIQPLPMVQLHGQHFDWDSSSDSDSTIHEDYLDQEQELDEGLPVHLFWATAG